MRRLKKIHFISISLLIALLTAYAGGFAWHLYEIKEIRHQTATYTKEDLQADAVVVLTGGSNRIASGLELFEEKAARLLLISGVNENVSVEKILSSADSRISQDLIECCVTFGRQAHNTRGNAEEVSQWSDDKESARESVKEIILVTSDYHMPRALVEFHHSLPGKYIIPYAVQSSISPAHLPKFLKVTYPEYNKFLLSWLKTNALDAYIGSFRDIFSQQNLSSATPPPAFTDRHSISQQPDGTLPEQSSQPVGADPYLIPPGKSKNPGDKILSDPSRTPENAR